METALCCRGVDGLKEGLLSISIFYPFIHTPVTIYPFPILIVPNPSGKSLKNAPLKCLPSENLN